MCELQRLRAQDYNNGIHVVHFYTRKILEQRHKRTEEEVDIDRDGARYLKWEGGVSVVERLRTERPGNRRRTKHARGRGK